MSKNVTYKGTLVARNSDLYAALESKDLVRAAALFKATDDAERKNGPVPEWMRNYRVGDEPVETFHMTVDERRVFFKLTEDPERDAMLAAVRARL